MVNEEDELPLPPLGVLMCWHAHMLNPRVFDRACDGAYAALRGKSFPLRRIVGFCLACIPRCTLTW